MDSSKPIDTPISPTKLVMDDGSPLVEEKVYRGMIGSLLRLTASRPDIVFSIGLCACFQSKPNESYLKAVKRILRYLKHTPNLALWYPKGCNFDLIGYADADYTGFLVDRKKHIRYGSLLRTLFGVLGNQEITLSCYVHS